MNPRQKRINYALAATLLTQGVPIAQIVPQVGAASVNSLRVGLFKKGVTEKKALSVPISANGSNTVNRSLTLTVASQASEILKNSFGSTVQTLADKLSEATKGVNSTIKDVTAAANALEPLSRVGDRLYNWSGAQTGGWNVTVLNFQPDQADPREPREPREPAIDVQEVKQIEPGASGEVGIQPSEG